MKQTPSSARPQPPSASGARTHPSWREALFELFVFAAGYAVYFGVRGLTEGSLADALHNAKRVVDFERALGLFIEPELQARIAGNHAIVTFFNWVYIWWHWPVIIVTAVWLFVRRPRAFYLVRNTFLISGTVGLVIFALFPVAPPRLAELDIIDTVTRYSNSYRVLQPPSFVNQYAAVPSLHLGWNLIIGLFLVRESRVLAVRIFGVVMPVAMFAAIVLTANHYIVDGFAGVALALAALWLAVRLHTLAKRLPPWPWLVPLVGVVNDE